MALLEAPQRMSSRDKRWWSALAAVIIASFVVLLWMGQQINVHKPPIPERVETAQGKVLVTKDQIINGQQVWQSIGGQQIGSVWGHGAYVAPDWTADWLHREATQILDTWAQKEGASDYAALGVEKQAALKARLKSELRTNGYQDGRIVLSDDRVAAFEANKNTMQSSLQTDTKTMPSQRIPSRMKPQLKTWLRSSGGLVGQHLPTRLEAKKPTPRTGRMSS